MRKKVIYENFERCRTDVHCHLTYDFGRYIAGLTLVSQITGIDISNINYAPAVVSTEYKQIAIESVQNAIRNPFEITPSSYTTKQLVIK